MKQCIVGNMPRTSANKHLRRINLTHKVKLHPKYELLLSMVRARAESCPSDEMVTVTVMHGIYFYHGIRHMNFHKNSGMLSFAYGETHELYAEPGNVEFTISLKRRDSQVVPKVCEFLSDECEIKD